MTQGLLRSRSLAQSTSNETSSAAANSNGADVNSPSGAGASPIGESCGGGVGGSTVIGPVIHTRSHR